MTNVRPVKLLLLHVFPGDVYRLERDRQGRVQMLDIDDLSEFISERASQFPGFSVFEGHAGEIDDDDWNEGGIMYGQGDRLTSTGDEWMWGAVRAAGTADVLEVLPELATGVDTR
jgi:hypothetical protein